jgi:hypothetical protein
MNAAPSRATESASANTVILTATSPILWLP